MAFISKAIDNMGKNPKYIIAYVFVLAVIVALVWWGSSKIKKVVSDLKDAADDNVELNRVEQESGKRKITQNQAEDFCRRIRQCYGWSDNAKQALNTVKNSNIQNDADMVYIKQIWNKLDIDNDYANWTDALTDHLKPENCIKINNYLISIGISNPYLLTIRESTWYENDILLGGLFN